MGRRLRQNDTNNSEIYVGHPISISDVLGQGQGQGLGLGLALGLGQGYRTSDIDIGHRIYIGCRIYILDVRYRFRKHWWHFVLTGASYICSYAVAVFNALQYM